MNESELGYLWDIGYEVHQEVVYIDVGDTSVSLTESDLKAMLETLRGVA